MTCKGWIKFNNKHIGNVHVLMTSCHTVVMKR